MAKFFKDFRAETVGAFSDPDFSDVTGSASIVDNSYPEGNALLCGGSTWSSVAVDGFKHPATVEVAGVIAISSDGSFQQRALNVYTSNGVGYLNGSGDAYAVRHFDNVIWFYKVSGGSFVQLAASVTPTQVDEDILRFKVEPVGADIVLTATYNDVEVLSYTDTSPLSLPVGGGVVSAVNRGGQADSAWYGIGIGTDGDRAPYEPPKQIFWKPSMSEWGQPPSNITIAQGNVAATVRDTAGEPYIEFASTGGFADWIAEVSALGAQATDALVDFEVVIDVTDTISTDLYVAGRHITTPDRNSVGGGVENYGNDGTALDTYDNGGGWGNASSATQPGNGRFYLRLRVEGRGAKLKWWLNGDPEPVSWLLENPDYFRNDMQPGLLVFYGYVNREWHLHSVGLGLGGAEAPLSFLPTPINLGAINLQATSARLTWEQG